MELNNYAHPEKGMEYRLQNTNTEYKYRKQKGIEYKNSAVREHFLLDKISHLINYALPVNEKKIFYWYQVV